SEVAFEVAGHRLHLLPEPRAEPNLTIDMPLGILEQVIRDGVSWDEAFIGYWCRMNRSPNVYHAGFWRLLQAPYYRKPPQLAPGEAGPVGPESTIAEVLESYGQPADLILRRHGLY